jgi:regulation of enolase protein 1 (concanavalin A-like superfamily)
MKKKSILFKLTINVLIGYIMVNNAIAQDLGSTDNKSIKTIPYALKEFNSPLNVEIKDESKVKITSKGKTNLFNSPGDNYYKQDAPMLLFHPDSNFIFSAKVEADLNEIYDVAALVLYQDKDLWAKLCYENSIEKKATVVSVVTKRYSDDCNSIEIEDRYVYLAMAKKGNELSFHCSTDNENWYLVRHFRMDFSNSDLMIGFTVHCSRGEKPD